MNCEFKNNKYFLAMRVGDWEEPSGIALVLSSSKSNTGRSITKLFKYTLVIVTYTKDDTNKIRFSLTYYYTQA